MAASIVLGIAASAQSVTDVKVDSYNMKRSGSEMLVGMNLDLSSLDVPSNRAVLLTPVITDGQHSKSLSTVGVYGRRRYIVYDRNHSLGLTGSGEKVYKASESPSVVNYNDAVPYESWMDGASLVLRRSEYGCCQNLLGQQTSSLGQYSLPVAPVFKPEYAFVQPEVEARKTRSLAGSAYIDYVVNRSEINPSYRGNASELAKISATIDSVRNDPDITVTGISIKGFASPDGSYAHNEKLARERTASLKEYVRKLYSFDDKFIKTSYEAEDWDGLRKAVEGMDIANKDGILEIIDGSLDPDAKDARIKSKYPTQYKELLHNVYPSLRHSDYRIEYDIREFQSVEEIASVYRTSPQKLSLQELYTLARKYEPGSDQYNDIFETAVKLYPNDETANLNAASAALQRGDLVYGEKYLKKAGNSATAQYTRGILQALKGSFQDALSSLKAARSAGESKADGAISQVNDILRFMKENR